MFFYAGIGSFAVVKEIQAFLSQVDVLYYGNPAPQMIDSELKSAVDSILAQTPVTSLIWGCAHYPMGADHLKCFFPALDLVNPASEEILAVQD